MILATLLVIAVAVADKTDAQTKGSVAERQLDAFARVHEYVKSHSREQPERMEPATGPNGNLLTGTGAPCGQSFTRSDVLAKGVITSLAANVGTGPVSDTTVYQYTMYEIITDPNGQKVFEGSNSLATKNLPNPPEFGYIGLYSACPVVGKYTLEQFLFVDNSGLKMLDRKSCTFDVTQ
jgi:hypothetical protein